MHSMITQIDSKYETQFEQKITSESRESDPAHDLLHVQRVVRLAKQIAALEGANPWVVVPAAWLHDVIVVPKNDPQRKFASRRCAEVAIAFLQSIDYPNAYIAPVAHAIEAHSFSAGIQPKTLEAKVVQDADRLDGVGAIGVARCFATAGLMRRTFYSEVDPFCDTRDPNDAVFTLDHFYAKLFKTVQTLQTASAKQIGKQRLNHMQSYLDALRLELQH